DSGIGALFGPAASGRGPLLVDRALDDLLQDDLRVAKEGWHLDEENEFERWLIRCFEEDHGETDAFFGQLESHA
ncbi:MAG: hypothetical protein KJ000_31660, partial [Pirellulaceae bacterium]|nr:hypothetical protein [Pirellulaceae bacterium]